MIFKDGKPSTFYQNYVKDIQNKTLTSVYGGGLELRTEEAA